MRFQNKFLQNLKFSLLFSLLLVSYVFATGISKSVNVGPKAIGMGGAFVGIADDATAIYHNPAGITQLDGHSFFLGADTIITDMNYDPTGSTDTEKAKTELLPVPTFAFVSDIAKPVYLGVGLFFPHGNGGEYGSNSAIPSNPNEGRIYSMEIIPTIAYKSDIGLSIGAGFRIIQIQSQIKGQIIDLTGMGNFDTIEDLDVDGWAFGASLGLFYKPVQYVSFGASLRSTVNKDLDGRIKTLSGGFVDNNLGSDDNQVTLSQTLPLVVHAGFGIYPTEKLTLGLSYQFEKNDQVEEYKVSLANGAVERPLPQNWENSHTIHVGADYQATEKLAVRAGYAKDLNDSIPDNAINRVVNDIAAHEISAGAAYQIKQLNIGLTWNGRFGERNVAATTTTPGPGKYQAFLHSISLGLGYKL